MPVLGPEMQSTGEAMGSAPDFETALARAYLGAGIRSAQPSKAPPAPAEQVAPTTA
jgi:hypothetical protein